MSDHQNEMYDFQQFCRKNEIPYFQALLDGKLHKLSQIHYIFELTASFMKHQLRLNEKELTRQSRATA